MPYDLWGIFSGIEKNEILIYDVINTPDAELFRETAIFLTWDNRTFPAAQIQKESARNAKGK